MGCGERRDAARLPHGAARAAGAYQSLLGEIRYEKLADAVGAHGERIEHAHELPAAIERCLAALDEGRSAILAARIEPVESLSRSP